MRKEIQDGSKKGIGQKLSAYWKNGLENIRQMKRSGCSWENCCMPTEK